MVKTLILLSLSFALAGLPALAQSADQASSNSSHKYMNMTGNVKSYDPGKSIEVDVKGKAHTFDLTQTDATYTVSPDVKVGSEVRVTERTDSSGRRTVMIEPSNSRTSKKPDQH
jgi:hypothetical protein